MKLATQSGAIKPLLFWLAATVFPATTLASNGPVENFINKETLPYGFSMSGLQAGDEADPGKSISLEATGWGVRLGKVELLDATGKTIYETKDQQNLTLPTPLAFGTRYTLKVTAERSWSGQSETREINFATVAVPNLDGPRLRMLEPDASVVLHFDRPVGELQAKGDLSLRIEPDATGQNIRLVATDYSPDRTYPLQLQIKSPKGVDLPPLSLELTTAPSLSAETNLHGLSNLGLVLPLRLTFSEALADRASAASYLHVNTVEGVPVAGKWIWQGPRQMKFTPQPAWPASSTLQVTADPQNLRSVRGGTMRSKLIEQFSTGTDRRLYVYLDRQQVEAVENGQVVRTFKVSTGKSKTPTVTGNFYIYDRYRHKTMRSDVGKGQQGYYEVEDVPYTQFFHKDFAFHGAFWHNSFGHPASHGCVNLATKDKNTRWPNAPEDAGWLFRWAALGVPVTVTRQAIGNLQAESTPASEGKAAEGEVKAEASADGGPGPDNLAKAAPSPEAEPPANP